MLSGLEQYMTSTSLSGAGWVVQSLTVLLEGNFRGMDTIGIVLELLGSSLAVSMAINQPGGVAGATELVAAHGAIVWLCIVREFVGGFNPAAVKLVVEYAFFLYILSVGYLQEQPVFQQAVAVTLPAMRCLGGVAQVLANRRNGHTGCLSLVATVLAAGAAYARFEEQGGLEASAEGMTAAWPMYDVGARVLILGQVILSLVTAGRRRLDHEAEQAVATKTKKTAYLDLQATGVTA